MKRSKDKFDYMLLSRLKQDCLYFLNWGGRSVNILYTHDIDAHLKLMWELWQKCRPQWLTKRQLKEIEKQMRG